jgi:hypothetical protein
MTEPSVTTEIHQPLDVHRHLSAQIAFNDEFAHLFSQSLHLIFGERANFRGWVHIGLFADLSGPRPSNSIDGGEGHHDMIMLRNVDPDYSCHLLILQLRGGAGKTWHHTTRRAINKRSALALFVPGILTNDPHRTFSLKDLAVTANFLD